MIYIANSELYHYGVKGMKWGVRKEYEPVGRKKASNKKLTAKQKRFIKYGMYAAGAALAVAGGVYLYKSGAFNSLVEKGKAGLNSSFLKNRMGFTASDIKHCNTSKAYDLQVINRGLKLSDSTCKAIADGDITNLSFKEKLKIAINISNGKLTNCKLCTSAAALRRKGYDVVAGTSPPREITENLEYFPGTKIQSLFGNLTDKTQWSTFATDIVNNGAGMNEGQAIKELTKKISSFGNGAYGELQVQGGPIGHSVEFSVERGAVRVYDNQLRRTYNSLDDFFSNGQYIPAYSLFSRYDNVQPDIDKMIANGIIKMR